MNGSRVVMAGYTSVFIGACLLIADFSQFFGLPDTPRTQEPEPWSNEFYMVLVVATLALAVGVALIAMGRRNKSKEVPA